jgi:hypothetical protein
VDADDLGFYKALCVLIVVFWPAVPVALPVFRAITRRVS